MPERAYGGPTAFRAAIEDRLLAVAGVTRWQLPQLHVELPAYFDVPDRTLRARGHAAEARRPLLQSGRRLDEAPALARALLDPVLDGTARGCWVPADRVWSGV